MSFVKVISSFDCPIAVVATTIRIDARKQIRFTVPPPFFCDDTAVPNKFHETSNLEDSPPANPQGLGICIESPGASRRPSPRGEGHVYNSFTHL